MKNRSMSLGVAIIGIVFACSISYADIETTIEFLKFKVDQPYRLDPKQEKFARANIIQGLWVLSKLLNHEPPSSDSKQHAKDIVSLTWALYHLAVEKKSGFQQGAFNIEDPESVLFLFYRNFEGTKGRPSTHLKELKKITHEEHYGIDILGIHEPWSEVWHPFAYGKLDSYSKYLDSLFNPAHILPTQKSHILFGKIPKVAGFKTDRLYLKMEDHGLFTWKGYFFHAKDLAESIKRRVLGEDKNDLNKRERIDSEILNLYLEIQKGCHAEILKMKNPKAFFQAAEIGVGEMLKQVQLLFSEVVSIHGPSEECTFSANHFFDYLHTSFAGDDSIDVRIGNEVIATWDDLHILVKNHSKLIEDVALKKKSILLNLLINQDDDGLKEMDDSPASKKMEQDDGLLPID